MTETIKSAPTFVATIYLAGEYADAKRLCREFVAEGLCVTVTPTEFIYTDGAESGVAVGILNYPRFPTIPCAIKERAIRLALHLRAGLFQRTALVRFDDETVWLPRESE